MFKQCLFKFMIFLPSISHCLAQSSNNIQVVTTVNLSTRCNSDNCPSHCGPEGVSTCGGPVISSDNSCGPSSSGNYTCPTSQCCSSAGFCGTSQQYCSTCNGCQLAFGICSVENCAPNSISPVSNVPSNNNQIATPIGSSTSTNPQQSATPTGSSASINTQQQNGTPVGQSGSSPTQPCCGPPTPIPSKTSSQVLGVTPCAFANGYCPNGQTTENIPRPEIGSIPYGVCIYHCVNPGDIAITFDGGPTEYTAAILDAVKDYPGAKFTFFIVGDNAGDTTHENVILRAFKEGHQLASGTWSYANLSTLTVPEIRQQMVSPTSEIWLTAKIYNEMAIRNILGSFPTYMHPPYGYCDQECQNTMRGLGYHVIIYDIDSKDKDLSSNSIQSSQSVYETAMEGSNPLTQSFLALNHDTNAYTTYVWFSLNDPTNCFECYAMASRVCYQERI
ncbi:Chitin deacetylase [Neolecta irregularis DAH-3]|uniref:Chitin deacetylase n=1 Tax=Neolecta irregularis (strain DAH-3) TaxID=1198029 RepID=A0A1U7LMB6_NEOID|nr:Chitin deacetylase [Neolecta irregularis DAH-3]|eukprot:OLL23810.1 Chitin deacetylase [Neolecta irregularis DAH-3]